MMKHFKLNLFRTLRRANIARLGHPARVRIPWVFAMYPRIKASSKMRLSARALRKWVNDGRAGKSRDMRELLRDYVLILANTGMRHGTEAQNLRWKHISTFEQDGRS